VLPAVWPVESDTEEGALVEAKALYESRITVPPALLIDWESQKVRRIVVNTNMDVAQLSDTAGELFGIATTAEQIERIAAARDEEISRMEAES